MHNVSRDNVSRDIVNAGLYLCAIVALLGGVALAGAMAFTAGPAPSLPGWMASLVASGPESETRLSQALANAQEIKAALAKPITPEPLPPITAKVAHGYLISNPTKTVHAHKPSRDALNAMAMEVPYGSRPAGNTFTPPELHKVY